MTKRIMVTASDGAVHTFPEGFRVRIEYERWLTVIDEHDDVQAMFYQPRKVLYD